MVKLNPVVCITRQYNWGHYDLVATHKNGVRVDLVNDLPDAESLRMLKVLSEQHGLEVYGDVAHYRSNSGV